jgi:hypothetical protein
LSSCKDVLYRTGVSFNERIDVVVSNIVAEGLTPTNFEVVSIFGVNPIVGK